MQNAQTMQMTQMTQAGLRRTQRAAGRAATLTATVLAAALSGLVPALAAEGDGIAGYPSAQQAIRSDQVRDTVSRFLVSTRQSGSGAAAADGGSVGAPANAPAAVAAPPGFDLKDPVPLFEISPEFVTGKGPADPQTALRLSYLTSRVTASDGKHAAVLLAPKGNAAATGPGGQGVGAEGWQLAGVRDGDAEVGFAERGTPQARTFTEPQIHAWYRLTAEGVVEPLNDEATTGLGGKRSLPLASYQKLVAARYGDKLPGSAYDRKGLAGGYGGLVEDRPEPVAATSGTAAADASWQPLSAPGAAAVAVVLGAVVYVRRRGTAR
ncbi:hypothetical protein ACF059_05030 [Streptomyces sp. NPDC016562]|uniref:hypothetical protein n=1 Tax=Streptomyces sp. NPDC016562 TaxID=3364966 RepID=UPI0036F53767